MAFTLPVVTGNVAELAPCGMVTEAGTLAAEEFELESVTTAPPPPATPVRLIVPVPDCPLMMVLGETETPPSVAGGGFTVTAKVSLAPEYEAVNVTVVGVLTLPAVT